MLEQGVIQPTKSAWGSSLVLVVKKTGDWRLCIDYRAVNRVTKKEAYPMPLIDDMLNSVGQSSWFCLIDLKSAYWQIPMEESLICKTTFSTQKGHYEFTRMPFGLRLQLLPFRLGQMKYYERWPISTKPIWTISSVTAIPLKIVVRIYDECCRSWWMHVYWPLSRSASSSCRNCHS